MILGFISTRLDSAISLLPLYTHVIQHRRNYSRSGQGTPHRKWHLTNAGKKKWKDHIFISRGAAAGFVDEKEKAVLDGRNELFVAFDGGVDQLGFGRKFVKKPAQYRKDGA